MSGPQPRSAGWRLETWLWTGPVGHFVGGALDICEAIARHVLLPRLRRLRERHVRALR